MRRKYVKKWQNFVETSSEFLNDNMHKSRVTLKYRNKQPSHAKLYVTNDNKSFLYKMTEKSDLDKIESYVKSLLHMLANKPIEEQTLMTTQQSKAGESKVKAKKGKSMKK